MFAATPQDVIRLWAERFNGADLDGLRPLYEDDVVLAVGNGEHVVMGIDAVIEHWRALLGSTIEVRAAVTLVSGDLAMTHNRCTVTLPDGTEVGGVGAEVLRRGSDGGWRYAICNPHG